MCQLGVQALELPEVNHPDLTAVATRELRKLITPDARLRLCTALLEKGKPTLKDLKAGCKEEQRRLWLECHWRKGNPKIPDTVI